MGKKTKKDAIIYLLGAIQRLVTYTNLSETKENFLYNMLDAIHRFIEEDKS